MKTKNNWIFFVLIAIAVGLAAAFFYYDRGNDISAIIQKMGWPGAVLAVLFMAIFCMTPIPSEALAVMYLKIYGVFWGTVLSWLGSIVSSVIIYFIARQYGQQVMCKMISPERFNLVNDWVERKGTAGLFVARMLPLPAFAVNYIAGVIPSIRFWPYLWTAAISIIPYYIGTALVFLGIIMTTWCWLLLGGAAIAVFWSVGYIFNRKKIGIDPRRVEGE
ncbi:MAG: TVP38/TMEM64 family inner membrane protein YdjZ [Candidatus Dichloromethanomonas elyunquensis]|nr:MAG: TVP38/TMEM64 family inner membrane protein YdjZ [Candidatus Dichloromethanomonas elyunquensis]